MDGYQLTFYTLQDRRHDGQPLAEWLFDQARSHGALGATMFAADASFGHHGRLHAAHFFELADQPVGIMVAVDAATCDRLLAAIRAAGEDVFYIRLPIEYGRTGTPAGDPAC